MKPFATVFGLPLGFSSTFWFLMGFLRYVHERWRRTFHRETFISKYKPAQIGVIIPAHNEELVIRNCISALKQSLSARQIHVVSDGSKDQTADEARKEGVNVTETTGVGKAKAIIHAIKTFGLLKRYKFIFIVDADTRIDPNFVKKALPLFNDPDIGVMFGGVQIKWPTHLVPRLKYYFISYRERLDRMLQYFFVYGQTWKFTNTTYVIPGFATIWRSKILKQVKIDTPGLLIEDFNTAFQVQKHKLCKIAYSPGCIGWDQHPETLPDYWKQVKRWNIGFFQTVRLNGIWPSWYWLSLGIFSLEVFVNSFFILLLPFLVLYLLIPALSISHPLAQLYTILYQYVGPFQKVRLVDLFVTFCIFDYGMTVVLGLTHKKPQFILYGLFFFFMHYVTSLILISSLYPGFFTKSAGRWVSPKRSLEQMQMGRAIV